MVGRRGPGRTDPGSRCAAALRGRLPAAAAGYVRGSTPAGAAVARCARCLPAAERGVPGPGGQGTGTQLAGSRTNEPPPRAADTLRGGRRIAARTPRPAPPLADPPPVTSTGLAGRARGGAVVQQA